MTGTSYDISGISPLFVSRPRRIKAMRRFHRSSQRVQTRNSTCESDGYSQSGELLASTVCMCVHLILASRLPRIEAFYAEIEEPCVCPTACALTPRSKWFSGWTST